MAPLDIERSVMAVKPVSDCSVVVVDSATVASLSDIGSWQLSEWQFSYWIGCSVVAVNITSSAGDIGSYCSTAQCSCSVRSMHHDSWWLCFTSHSLSAHTDNLVIILKWINVLVTINASARRLACWEVAVATLMCSCLRSLSANHSIHALSASLPPVSCDWTTTAQVC